MKDKNKMVYDAREVTTFKDILEGSAELYGERTAFIFSDAGNITEVTFSQTFENVKAFAAYLRSVVPEGAKVARYRKEQLLLGYDLSYRDLRRRHYCSY